MGRVSDARERLIEAATKRVWLESYGAVSVDDICDEAGVKKGSFYHFFKSKDELIVAALDARWQARKGVFDSIFSPTKPPLDRLRAYFRELVERQTEMRRESGHVLGCFYGSIGTECIHRSPVISAKIHEIMASYTKYFETTLRDAQARGDIGRGDPVGKARALFALIEGVLGQARIEDSLEPVRHLERTGMEFIGASPSASKRVSA